MDRRQLLAGLAMAPGAASPMQAAAVFDRGFASVTRIADGVYATIANISKGLQCASNGGIIAGRDAALIVEGHFEAAGAAFEIEAAEMLARGTVRAAVVTHFHFDHSFGTSAYVDRRIPVAAYDSVTALMKERYAALQGVDKSALLAPLQTKVARAAGAIEKARRQADLDKTRMMYSAIDSAVLAYPTELLRTADLPKRIDLGGLTAVIEHHPGHTTTDLIVRVPERDVVFAGDLLFFRAYPVTVDADMVSWRKVLDRFSTYGRRTQFVPGHGPVCGIQTARDQADLMDDLRAHAEKMMSLGITAEEAERRYVVPKPFESYRISAWGWTVGPAMTSFFARRPGNTRPVRNV